MASIKRKYWLRLFSEYCGGDKKPTKGQLLELIEALTHIDFDQEVDLKKLRRQTKDILWSIVSKEETEIPEGIFWDRWWHDITLITPEVLIHCSRLDKGKSVVDIFNDELKVLNENYEIIRNKFQTPVWKIPKNTLPKDILGDYKKDTWEEVILLGMTLEELVPVVPRENIEEYLLEDTTPVSMSDMEENIFFREVDGKLQVSGKGFMKKGLVSL